MSWMFYNHEVVASEICNEDRKNVVYNMLVLIIAYQSKVQVMIHLKKTVLVPLAS